MPNFRTLALARSLTKFDWALILGVPPRPSRVALECAWIKSESGTTALILPRCLYGKVDLTVQSGRIDAGGIMHDGELALLRACAGGNRVSYPGLQIHSEYLLVDTTEIITETGVVGLRGEAGPER